MAASPENLIAFALAVVSNAEGRPEDRYRATFSTGNSGLSFGALQGDARVNPAARAVLTQILNDARDRGTMSAETVQRVLTRGVTWNAAQRAADPQPLTAQELEQLNDALGTPASRALIDRMDQDQVARIADSVWALMNAMVDRPTGPGCLDPLDWDPNPCALLLAWCNRVGDLKQTQSWLRDADGQLTPALVDRRLRGQKQFQPKPSGGGESYDRWRARILAGVPRVAVPVA
ncbi:MAG: hypothetical protein HQL39_10505 [Alphaproteobacteria bacterium]|nr:hypothetical protein [Alphaproteobacteria bacterium]